MAGNSSEYEPSPCHFVHIRLPWTRVRYCLIPHRWQATVSRCRRPGAGMPKGRDHQSCRPALQSNFIMPSPPRGRSGPPGGLPATSGCMSWVLRRAPSGDRTSKDTVDCRDHGTSQSGKLPPLGGGYDPVRLGHGRSRRIHQRVLWLSPLLNKAADKVAGHVDGKLSAATRYPRR